MMNTVGSVELVTVNCEEYAHVDVPTSLLLTPDGTELDLYDSVRDKDYFRVSFTKSKVRFTASSYVGVIPLNDRVLLRVKPRVPVANLTHMVEATGQPILPLNALRSYRSHGDASDWMLDQYAHTLIEQVAEVLRMGVYRRYVPRTEVGGYPRGRIDFQQTAARFAARNVPNRAVYTFHERTVDIAPNQTLKAALLAMHAHLTRPLPKGKIPEGYGTMLATLATQVRALEDVSTVPFHLLLRDAEVTGVRPLPEPRYYYRNALDVALLVLQGRGVVLDLGGEAAKVRSLLVEMNDLFEAYTRLVLQQEAARRHWPVEVLDQKGKVPLYTTPETPPAPLGYPMNAVGPAEKGSEATPDIVCRMPDGTVVLVGEVKNTKKGVLPDRSEVNQAVTYAVRYGLDKALLIRPWTGGAKGLGFAGQVGNIAVYDYKADLSADDLTQLPRDFADAVAGLMPVSATHSQVPVTA